MRRDQTMSKLTPEVLIDALDTEVIIIEYIGEPGRYSRRKLTYDVTGQTFNLWIGETLVWTNTHAGDAIEAYNTFDAGLVDYTPENLAYAGI